VHYIASVQEKIASSRESLKAQVWRDIHLAALKLAMDEGLAAATIDRIAEKSGISRRTFFNYFPGKENAILGIHEPSLSDEALAEFSESAEDNLTRAVFLLINVFRTARPLATAEMNPRDVVEKFPELLANFTRSGEAVAKLVEPVIRSLFETESNDGVAEAQMLVAAARVIIISTYTKNPALFYSSSPDDLISVIHTFRKSIA
jgi:AcrR family transcriptional regulator